MIDSLSPALQADDLVKIYDEGPARIEVLSNVSLSVARGEMVAIVGASGSGKSTLLHILGLLDVPTSGSVAVDGQLAVGLSEAKKSQVRNRSLGFVYQFHHLLPEFSALDNVAMPLIVRRENRDKARAAAREVLGLVGLAAREGHFPGQLSGGERQMLAVGRALMAKPALLMLDEPSLGLAPRIVREIFHIIARLRETGVAILLVEQNARAALQVADYGYVLETGEVILHGPARELAGDPKVIESYLGLGKGAEQAEA